MEQVNTTTQEVDDEQRAIELMTEMKVKEVWFRFSCGGDSMNDTDIEVHYMKDKDDAADAAWSKDKEAELVRIIDNIVYVNVDFYDVSDGHYIGENGTVNIYLVEDDDDPNKMVLEFDKESTEEWENEYTVKAYITIDPAHNIGLKDDAAVEYNTRAMEFYADKIDSIDDITRDNNEALIRFRQDLIISDDLQNFIDSLRDAFRDIDFSSGSGYELCDGEELEDDTLYELDDAYWSADADSGDAEMHEGIVRMPIKISYRVAQNYAAY